MNKYKMKRLRTGLNQYDLARLTGIHQSRISLIENGYVTPNDDERTKLDLTLKPTAKPKRSCNDAITE